MNGSSSLYARLLILTHESVGDKISGPGVRAWEIAKALGYHGVNVTLATPFRSNRSAQNVVLKNYSWEFPETIKKLIEETDVLLASGPVVARLVMTLKRPIEKPVIVDAYYIPEIEEIVLSKYKYTNFDPLPAYLNEMFLYLRQGDSFLYAFEKQLDFLLGTLLVSARINKLNDQHVQKFLLKVPLGIPDSFALEEKKFVKGSIEGISNDDKVLYWGGGVWEWSNPFILVEAIESISSKFDNIRVVFGALHHYDQSTVPVMKIANEFFDYIQRKGWINKKFFFLDWIPYDYRGTILQEADCGLSIFSHPLESRYAARARLMDYLWTGLPCIVSGEDEISKLLVSLGLAIKVDPLDSANLGAAIIEILDRPFDRFEWLKNHEEIIELYKWYNVVRPLLDYLAHPQFALDAMLARDSMEYAILLRKEWEELRTYKSSMEQELSSMQQELNRLKDLVVILQNRRVIKLADKYGEIRKRLLKLLMRQE